MVDSNEEAGMEMHNEKASIKAIQAAMMEELGMARKDTLPLEDKNGLPGRVDLDALDRGKKANNPRTAEYKIAAENLLAHLAWKNAKFGDIEQADLELDQMDSGQSHRLRLKRKPEAFHNSRGGYATRGGRGAQVARNGGNHPLSRSGTSNCSGNARSDRVSVDRVYSQLGGRFSSNDLVRSSIRGAVHDSSSNLITAPKGKVSFGGFEERSAFYTGTIKVQMARRAPKPNNYSQGLGLASQQEFLLLNRTAKSEITGFSDAKEDSILRNDVIVKTSNTQKATAALPNTKARDIQEEAEQSATSVDIKQKSEKLAAEGIVGNAHDLVYSSPVQIGHDIGGTIMLIGFGTIHIKAVDYNTQFASVFQIEREGKILLEEPLLDDIEFSLEFRNISFHSGLEGERIKWTLSSPKPEVAADLLEAFKRFNYKRENLRCSDFSGNGNISEEPTLEKCGNLISWSEEDPVSLPITSKFQEDLLSLMVTQPGGDTKKASDSEIKQDHSSSVAVMDITGTGENQSQQNALHGLAMSRHAEVSENLTSGDRSDVFQKLLESPAAIFEEQIGKKVIDGSRTYVPHRKASKPIKQKPWRQYSIEELTSLRYPQSSVCSPPPLDPHLGSCREGKPNPVFPSSEPGEPVVPGRETSKKSSYLTSSKYANKQIKEVLGKVGKSASTGTFISEHIQEHPHWNGPNSRAKDVIPGLPASKSGCQSTGIFLTQEYVDASKSEPFNTDLIHKLSVSFSHFEHMSKPFKPFLDSKSQKNVSPRSLVKLSASNTSGDSIEMKEATIDISNSSGPQLANFSKQLSIPDHYEPVSSKVTRVHSKLDRPQHQGLSSSRYAGFSPAKVEKKSNALLATIQIESKAPGSVDKSSMPVVKVPSIIHKTASRNDLESADSESCDNFTSHKSEDLNQTAKLPSRDSLAEPILDHNLPFKSPQPASNHQSLPSEDLLNNYASIISPVEDSINIDGAQPTNSQPGASTFEFFPHSGATKPTGVTAFSGESSDTADMSKLIGNNWPAALQSANSDAEPLDFKSSRVSTTSPGNTLAVAKGGLMSSRYATADGEVAPGMQSIQSHTAKAPNIMENSSNTERFVLKARSTGPEPGHHHRVLQPSASQFTPSSARGQTISTHTLPPPVMSPLSQTMQPAMATVLVPDPQRPGFLTEVCGYLKMSSTPIVGFVVSENSPTSEGLASASNQAHKMSPRMTLDRAQRTTLSSIPRESENVTGRQQEIQERLTLSLAKRRLFESSSPSSH